ncbi:MAG: hypothetical protein GVY19_12160, partial [Bacteroidetes bacterium]|nr:hypothetical protein [Bacteroidota bacterium]
LKSTASDDSLQGNDIYANLNLFIAVGESAAEVVEEIILSIAVNDLDEPKSLTFEGEDGRKKDVEITESQVYAGITYDFGLTIKDKVIEEETGNGTAMQVYWNNAALNDIDGVAILKPAYINLNDSSELADAMYRIHYNETTNDYDAEMLVEIAGIPLKNQDIFGIDNLKMFVGKSGDKVEVKGNSNHPNAILFSTNQGFNWAFVAAGFESENIAVAELGLPPSGLDSDERNVLLVDNSIRNVFLMELKQAYFPNLNIEDIADIPFINNYLKNTEAPGYFNANGFVAAGTAPSENYAELETSIEGLVPYNPSAVAALTIEFE